MIKEIGSKFYVFSKEGNKKLSNGYKTEDEAKKRLKQIESFKNLKQDEKNKIFDSCDYEDIFNDEDFEDAEYQGKGVALNKPFRNSEGKSKFSVYVKNDKGNVIKVNFGDPNMEIKRDDEERKKAFRERHNCEQKTDKTTAGYWSCKFWSSKKVSKLLKDNQMSCPCRNPKFQDKAFTMDIAYNDNQTLENKKVVSVRDGYQEYLGAEIGVEPFDKVFKIYRSPETIRELNNKLKDIPLTIDHLDDLDSKVPDSEKVGRILNSNIIDAKDKDNDSTINLENEILTDKNKLKYNDYKQLSLGYKATTLPHEKYDFEQIEIIPHHLAIVEKGRCGDGCKFLDKQGEKMDLKELLKELKKALGSAEEKEMTDALATMKDMFPKEDTKDEEMEAKDEEIKAKDEEIKKMKDSIARLEKETLVKFQDSASFKKAMLDAGNERVSVINKAVKYLDKDYEYEAKTNSEIMADSLKAEFPNESFNDSEIGVAFKMLKDEVKAKEVNYNDSDLKTITDKFKEEF